METEEPVDDDEPIAGEDDNDNKVIKIRLGLGMLKLISVHEANINCMRKLRSKVWGFYKLLAKEDNAIQLGKVICPKCQHIFNHEIPKTSTSNLMAHECYKKYNKDACNRKPKSKCAQENSRNEANEIKSKLSQKTKDALWKAEVGFIARDLHAFRSLQGKGLHELLSVFTDVAIENGRPMGSSVCGNILSHRTTVSRRLRTYTNAGRKTVKKIIEKAILENGFAVTADLWKDKRGKKNYLAVTAHLVGHDYVMQEYCLGLENLPDDFKHSGENIKLLILEVFKKLGLEKYFNENLDNSFIVFISDRGGNVRKALRLLGCDRFACFAHILNNTVHDMCKCDQMTIILDDASKLIKFAKSKRVKSSKFAKKLRAMVITRWNSACVMLQSILDNYDDIVEFLKNFKEEKMLTNFKKPDLVDVTKLLSVFVKATTQVEGSKHPTLANVLPWISLLSTNYLLVQRNDSALIKAMKLRGNPYLQRAFERTRFHDAAILLHPNYRALRCIGTSNLPTDEEKQSFIDNVFEFAVEWTVNLNKRLELHAVQTSNVGNAIIDVSTNGNGTELDIESIMSDETSISIQSSLQQDEEQAAVIFRSLIRKELDLYLELKIYNSIIRGDGHAYMNKHLLKWWAANKNLFPHLSRFAQYIHGIPATSAPSERTFSTAGNIVTKLRNLLNPSSVSSLLFLCANWDSINDHLIDIGEMFTVGDDAEVNTGDDDD